MSRQGIRATPAKTFFTNNLTAAAVARASLASKMIIGAMITSLVFSEEELRTAETRRSLMRFITENNITAFPNNVVAGNKVRINR